MYGDKIRRKFHVARRSTCSTLVQAKMGKSKSKEKDREHKANTSTTEEKGPVLKQEKEPVVNKQEISLLEDDKSLVEVKPSYDELVKYLNGIAKPLAGKKLTKRLYKTVKKASEVRTLRRGVKDVSKAIRKGEKGIVVIAGDISPIDVISHLPVMCEDRNLPYAYVPSKLDLGTASLTKRPTSVVMIKQHDNITESYDNCFSKVKALPLPI